MLLIGTAISLVTAVAATRAMLGLLAGFRWFENPKFMGANHSQRGRWLQIDFMKRTMLWFAISGVILVVSIGSLAIRGLNLGIDFKGGAQITFRTAKPTSISLVRQQTAAIGRSDAVVQGRGTAYGSESYKSFQIRLKKLSEQEQNKLTTRLSDNVHAIAAGTTNVSSSFGRQIARSALLAIFFSMLIITLYITIRFRGLAFAVPVIAAMLHDVLITVGVYSITGREVTEATVAAVLTVLGYSIYDTIIIFDRIRENMPIMRRASFATITNISLWETIRRSLATTFITLLPVARAVLLRRRDPEGLRLRTARRRHLRRLLVDLHRRAAAQPLERSVSPSTHGARARRCRKAKRPQRLLADAEQASRRRAEPGNAARRVRSDRSTRIADAKREARRQRRKSRPHGRAR